ncbi:hypothetical protein A2697_03410 [Candidatus Curtissbacteria bacterium RIFCSPHIGHO2_01_FULL_41_44]|uniref:Methyltransferase type 11 domain-containing protein n=1 Tax=Candidatus Curtissbacteria bacterium RIFCSPLOWO2_01_FULL_42_50 TaxID=1797730 RepID=A0A1F5H505_9BACT|nr:MAG: hypothetical protein A2697_03410 [Candidatus Curtissbacteria bacterium RIFCSPHIGHO2_01_FULL_41_44]OGD97366.1 MAG: hypothetical protein A3E71_04165 [Candidatus Curtissbacteria bacterium RIFCSPHIGHO2_12_FULL_42_33]OGD99246.1 MAG: hypothetical protein A3B54_01605 [Candidatus Curtissbacteria bacterium RIFCSPLOWO2_01_FULL_42_50]OGE03572.1 MAG: hypothetical protein A3G16_00840 [Candidatus Curtissbacteria bacterium RIFCSPLOWO2_12_FULL_41_16]OGE11535.1 MAG: hypothetical protein A3H87_03130 [Can
MTQDLSRLAIQCFDRLAPFYDRKTANRKKYNTAIDNQIIKYLLKQDKPKVLDVGCGTGSRAQKLKGKIKGSRFFGVDASTKMVEIAKTKKLDSVLKTNMVKLPFEDSYFDDIICLFNSFGYLSDYQDRKKTLSEFYRVLSKGGLLFIDVMNAWHLGEEKEFKRSLLTVFWEWLFAVINPRLSAGDKIFSIDVGAFQISGFVHGFTDHEMRDLLKGAGFSIHKFLIIGYNSGEIKKKPRQGQFFYVAKKIN